MVREDLIDGAVTFLQDPSVSSAPLEQKISFLRSKNLTQEEIDTSLARVGQSSNTQAPVQQSSYSSAYRQPPPQSQYGGYQQQYPYWGQPPPPEIPRRDWRDWFIMATVMSGVSYSIYWTAKRYIYPLIAPPTPPQLEQDKASIDTSFEKAFALLDQLATDTQELKDSEAERKSRLDQALAEVESVVTKMKEANENRELEAKRMARDIEELKDQIPQAIQKEKDGMDSRLKDLASEMKSLKTLMGSRVGGTTQPPRTTSPYASTNGVNGGGSPPTTQGAETNGTNGSVEESEKTASVLPERTTTPSYAGRRLAGKAQIPAWQLEAKKKADEAKVDLSAQNTSESGTMADLAGMNESRDM